MTKLGLTFVTGEMAKGVQRAGSDGNPSDGSTEYSCTRGHFRHLDTCNVYINDAHMITKILTVMMLNNTSIAHPLDTTTAAQPAMSIDLCVPCLSEIKLILTVIQFQYTYGHGCFNAFVMKKGP